MNRTDSETRQIHRTQRKLQATADRIAAEFTPVPPCEHATVRLLPLDPWHLHAHWQVPTHTLKNLYKSKLPHLNPEAWVLRVYEVLPGEGITSESPWFELPGQGSRNSRDFRIGRDDVAYIAEIGVRIGPDGLFALATSREARPPPAPPQRTHRPTLNPSPKTSEITPALPALPDWRTLDDAAFRKFFAFLLPEAWDGAGGIAMNRLVRQRWNEKTINALIQADMQSQGLDIDTNALLTYGPGGSSDMCPSSHTHASSHTLPKETC